MSFQGITSGGELISAFDRNRELQIQQDQAARDPVLQAKVAEDVARRENEVQAVYINTAAQTFRSRCRTAAAKKLRAVAAVEAIISEFDGWLRDHRPSPGISIGEATARLNDMAAYVAEVKARLPHILDKIGVIAADESREEALEAARQRQLNWTDEGRRLGAVGCARAIEAVGRQLCMRDGRLGTTGGAPDDRMKTFIGMWREQIESYVSEREKFHEL